MNDKNINVITADIEAVRHTKPDFNTCSAEDIKNYYKELHIEKDKRQKLWLKFLIEQTASLFEVQLEKLTTNDKDPTNTTIVAALPEFFWCDINDNYKHLFDIVGYHKPLYHDNLIKYFTKSNELANLTAKYPNLIIFAGTVMSKQIEEDHTKEKIFNSLIIYHSGNFQMGWSKHHVSDIDGFGPRYSLLKNKVGESTNNSAPIINFNEHTFAFDICLDFMCGNNGTTALSTELCNAAKLTPDVNVLIAAGMPLNMRNINNFKSDILLRCDGLASPYGEIVKKGNHRVEGNIIDSIETEI
jgi:hypothetical protein